MKDILPKRFFVLFVAAVTAVLFLFAGSALAEPDISGQWQSNLGVVYTITQIGDKFTWHMPSTNQTGFGDIDGTNVSAVWPIGFATGTVTVDAANRGITINWSNGVIFTRPASSPPPPPTPAYTWEQIGTAASAIYAGGNRLFATNPGSGDIYEYNGTPGSWTKVGGPGNMFAVGGMGQLYGISPDMSGVWKYDGTPMNWTKIGGPASKIYAGGNKLFATNPGSGDIYQYNGTPNSWTKAGGPGYTFTVGGNGQLYGISPDMSGVWKYSGTPMNWSIIGEGAYAIAAAGNNLFGIQSGTLTVWRYVP